MRLRNSNKDHVNIDIIGYEFPHASEDETDVNWLVIRVDASLHGKVWSVSDPSLLTTEVARLIHWLEDIVNGSPQKSHCVFLEPCLSFEIVKNSESTQILRVIFELELRPPWRKSKIVANPDVYIDFPLNEAQLRESITILRDQLMRFPERKADGS